MEQIMKKIKTHARRKFYDFNSFTFQYPRILKYRILSDCYSITGKPKIVQPTLFCGAGRILFAKDVVLGTRYSPSFYSGYNFLEVRTDNSSIEFAHGVWTNNNLVIMSNGSGVYIGENTLIGYNVEIFDCDFHETDPLKRKYGNPGSEKVIISENVWIGSNVKILKGVTIGRNSIISNGSIVTNPIPENVIAGGIPARVIKPLTPSFHETN
jgi:maltose O-acetyltransferase